MVWSSGQVTFVTPASLRFGSMYPAPRFVPAATASTSRPHEKHASCAVAGWPSDHFMPVRMWNVQDFPSAARAHESAKPGTGSRFGPKSVSMLYVSRKVS